MCIHTCVWLASFPFVVRSCPTECKVVRQTARVQGPGGRSLNFTRMLFARSSELRLTPYDRSHLSEGVDKLYFGENKKLVPPCPGKDEHFFLFPCESVAPGC